MTGPHQCPLLREEKVMKTEDLGGCPRAHGNKPGMMTYVSNICRGGDQQIAGTCWPASLANLVSSTPARGTISKFKLNNS